MSNLESYHSAVCVVSAPTVWLFAVEAHTASLLLPCTDPAALLLKANKLFSTFSRMSAARLSAIWVSSNLFI